MVGGDGSEHPAAAPLQDGQRLTAGDAAIEVLRTPGHTPGSTSFVIDGSLLVSGDTVFVRGVGRPDLGGRLEEWGRALHGTLRKLLDAVPLGATVLPAHFSGAAEADAEGIVRASLAEVRARSPELAIEDARAFVDLLRAGARDAPAAYAEMVRANLALLDAGERAEEWELGRNECAAAHPGA